MKYLLHGDDTVASRKFLTGLVEGFKANTFDGNNLSVAGLEEAVLSRGLFAEKEAVIVENLLSRNAKKKDFIGFLNSAKFDTLLILWEDKKLPKTSFKGLHDFKIEEFLLPVYYFQFLDKLFPGNKKQVFELYQKLLASYAPEQLLFSLTKRVRLLLILNSGGKSEELSNMPPWMLSKLKGQARMWPGSTLVSFYNKLQEAEVKLKTGKLPVDLSKHLDILILTKL